MKKQCLKFGPYVLPVKNIRGSLKVLCPHCNRWASGLVGYAYACRRCLETWGKRQLARGRKAQK